MNSATSLQRPRAGLLLPPRAAGRVPAQNAPAHWLGTGKGNKVMTNGVARMRDGPPATDLVMRIAGGDQQAWNALVERYARLVWAICRRNGLNHADAEDVCQTVWLQLVDHLNRLRDPAALPGWLATTTRRECYRVSRARCRQAVADQAPDAENLPDEQTATPEHELLAAERHAALRAAFSDLPAGYQQLLALLIADPPVPYAEISARLGIAVGSIGPYRSRCLERLRRHPDVAALIEAEAA